MPYGERANKKMMFKDTICKLLSFTLCVCLDDEEERKRKAAEEGEDNE